MSKMRLLSFLLPLLFLMSGLAIAEDIYVKNKPFKGEVVGRGMDAELSLPALAEALGLEAISDNGYWKLGDATVPAREMDGTMFVNLKDLKKAGLKVLHSPDLGTVDISVGKKKTATSNTTTRKRQVANQDWGGSKPTLVYFGADW